MRVAASTKIQPASSPKPDDPEDLLKELHDIQFALDVSAIVAMTDAEGTIFYVNDAFSRISQYTASELIGNTHRIVNSGYHAKSFFKTMWSTIKDGRIWRGEICNRAKDGTNYWVNTTIVPFVDENRKPYQYVSIRFDVTAQKHSEQALAESERRLREQKNLLEQTHEAIFTWKINDGIIDWNKNAERLYGYSLTDVLGKEIYQLLRTEYEVSFADYFSQLKHEGKWEGELRQTTKSGKQIIVESRQVVSKSANNDFLVLETIRDITKRKLANERIRQQASLLNKAQDAIFVCDLNHLIIYWNNGAERVYGWEAEEVLGKNVCEIVCGGENDLMGKALHALRKNDDWQEETTQFTKDGRKLNVVSRWTLVRNEHGQPDYFLIINSDITSLKQIEEQLFRSQRMESIGTLAGGIAHDLNNVLSPILMSVEMLRSDPAIEVNARPWLSIIQENTERGANLIKQVLTFARGVEGERISVQIKHLVKDLIKVLRETLRKTIAVKYNIDPELPLIFADPTQIHQVLMNLCVNARDAMPEGGTMTVTATSISITEARSKFPAGRYIRLDVADTGTGIPPGVVERIFDPFFTTKEIGKGTGLGLSTALSIVKGHRGFIDVESEPGEGTRISVYLPAIETELDDFEKSPADIDLPRGSGELLLIVDDEESIRRVTEATLQKHGYKTLAAADGAEALTIFAEHSNDIALVLTDMAMPVTDGATVIRSLRKLNPKLKIISASGLAPDLTPEIHTDGSLAKPFTVEKLLTTVAAVLDGP